MICGTRSFSQVAVLDLVFLSTWDGVLRESLELPKGSQATCHVWWGMQDGSGANAGESGLISMWFGVHGALSCSCGDLRVYLYLWDYSWGLSGVPSRKSRLLSCLMGNTDLRCMQCRGIGPHLMARGKSNGFSRVVVGTWGMFSSYGGDGPSKLVLVQQRQDSCLVARDTSGFSSRLGRAIGTPLEVRRESRVPSQLPQGYWDSYQFSRGGRHHLLLKHWTARVSRVVKGMWGLLLRWVRELRLSHRGFRHPFILWDERRACIQVTAGKSGLISSQGISVSIPIEAATSGSLSHNYSWEKPPLEVLVESWHSSWVEARESALISRWFAVHGALLSLLCWSWCAFNLRMVL